MTEGGHPHNFYNLQFKAKTVNLVSQASTSPDPEDRLDNSASLTSPVRSHTTEVDGAANISGRFGVQALDHSKWVELTQDIDIQPTIPIRPGSRIYQGRQKYFGGRHRDVIVKILETSHKTEDEVARLLDLDHPNIVRILRTGEYLGKIPEVFIVMEKCLIDLQDYINRNKNEIFNFKKSFSYSIQLTEAVEYIHENNIVHRDLKPPNILISKCEKYIKISDFGISRVVTESADGALVTNSNDGTDGFKAPETYQEVAVYSYKSDIFALGINTYFIFTSGNHPFGSNIYRRTNNIIENINRDLTQIPSFKPPNSDKRRLLQQLIESMLQHDPFSRPTASEILQHEFFTGDKEKLSPLLELVECELHLKRGREEDSIQRLKQVISDSRLQSYSDVEKLAHSLGDNGHHIRAMIFLKVSYDLSKNQNMSPDARLTMIANFALEIKKAIKLLITEGGDSSRNIGEAYGYRYITNLLNDLRQVNSDNSDLHVRVEAECLVNITFIALLLNKVEESLEFAKHGVLLLESRFYSNAANCSYYGRLLNNLGYAYYMMNLYSRAELYYLKAIDAIQQSVNFENEDDTDQSIRIIKDNLRLTREKLEKNPSASKNPNK